LQARLPRRAAPCRRAAPETSGAAVPARAAQRRAATATRDASSPPHPRRARRARALRSPLTRAAHPPPAPGIAPG
jgi:hypothetical protein